MTTVSAAIAEAIADHATDVFALMGNGNAHLLDALARDGRVRITGLRHEQATVASADAYHRVARRLAVATTTYGPGFTNAITPLAEAACSRTPLLLIVGDAPTGGRRAWDVDQRALAEAVEARVVPVGAATPRATTRMALGIAEADRRPVVLSLPYDLAAAPAGEEAAAEPDGGAQDFAFIDGARPGWEHPMEEPYDPAPVAEQIAAAARLLASARRPLVLAGRGARAAAGPLGELADRIGALTASTAPARGTFASRGWDLGVCGGFASEPSSALIRRADAVLVVGASLNQFTTAFGDQFAPDAALIQVDLAEGPTGPDVARFVRGDAAAVVPALLDELEGHTPPARRWEGDAEHARDSRLNFARDTGTGQAADGRLDPRSAMERLNAILPADRQVVSDGGHFIGWSSYHLDLPAPDSLTLVGTQYQAIGLGLPSAPGAALARPTATTVVVTGDGGGLMGLPDLDSLVRTARSAVVLVFNDACYGAEIHQYGTQGLDEAIMEIEEANFAALGRGVGAQGLVVRTMADLDAVADWVAAGARGTLVVDLRISRSVVAPYIVEIIEKTLRK